MMRFTIASLALAAAEPTWDEWKFEYGVSYNGDDEETHRKSVFEANSRKIAEHNAQGLSWKMGMNHFGDRTQEEFIAIVSMPNKTFSEHEGDEHHKVSLEVASSIDWVDRGVFNPIRSQQNSDCWAHSAIGVLESNWKIHSGTLPVLTEQQLCDCSNSGTCRGGGDEDGALEWFENHKACTRASYPYKGTDSSCKESSCTAGIPKGAVKSTTYVDASASALKSALNGRPVTASVYADGLSQFYSSGVLTSNHIVDTGCGGSVDHAVIAVGYGSDGGESYFKLRNSWGKNWGEHGYVRLGESSSSKNGNACLFRWPGSYPNFDGSPAPSPRPSPSPSPSPSPDYYYSYYYYASHHNGHMGKRSRGGKTGRSKMGMRKSVIV